MTKPAVLPDWKYSWPVLWGSCWREGEKAAGTPYRTERLRDEYTLTSAGFRIIRLTAGVSDA